MDDIHPFPLKWPAGWPRNQRPEHSKFDATIFNAEVGVRKELRLLGATGVVITCNANRNRDGSVSSRQPYIEDTGVAVWFRLRGEQRVIPCDKWVSIAENIRAIEKMIGAIRGLDRWGARMMVDAAFQGFRSLPASTRRDWSEVLGVSLPTTREEIDRAYRLRARETHPDAGGSQEEFLAVVEAYRVATGGLEP